MTYPYIIIGAGLGGASAFEGIREIDSQGAICLFGAEKDLPYDRPPLSKQLWTGAQKEGEIFRHDEKFYRDAKVDLRLGKGVAQIDPAEHLVHDAQGATHRYEKLLLATGGTPRRLSIPGGDLAGLCYFRTLGDYHQLRGEATEGKSALVIGGGFIGSEIAAALRMNKLNVTLIFPEQYLVSRVFPEPLGRYLTDQYRAKGVQVISADVPASIERAGDKYLTRTRAGKEITTDLVVVGVGIAPNISLARSAGLETGNGVVVNDRLQTSNPDIYAAGDIAFFPDPVLGPRRIEHWDNALNQGKHAGKNMAGANQPFTYMPFFFSDLFEFGYEAVGEIDSRLETFSDWQEPNKTGVIYYLDKDRLRGAMMCNVWEKTDAARALIQKQDRVSAESLRGAIR
jgi:NADPH-dependent 2,4-dienoyl-CoA reductase/sulfur reductase-like enzyme